MKVVFLADKYKCGSNRGLYYHDKENFLEDLNSVLDFAGSKYPEKWVEKEGDNTKYVAVEMERSEFFEGKEEKLVPGHMFVYDGQVFAIDSPDRLILAVSETGALAAKRFIEDVLGTEIKLEKGREDYNAQNVIITEIDEIQKDNLAFYSIPYYLGKVWRDKVNPPKKFKVEFESNNSFTPVTLFFDDSKIWYNQEEIFEEQFEDLVMEFLCWSWKNN